MFEGVGLRLRKDIGMQLHVCSLRSVHGVVSSPVHLPGYGTTMPLSDGGRLFCILYCMVGIPVTLLLLSCLTHALLPWVTGRPILHLQTRWALSKSRAALTFACVLTAVTGVVFFLLPAIALSLMERDWNFLEALYFCFISLSTIGLGDYLPGRTHDQAARQGLEFATSCE